MANKEGVMNIRKCLCRGGERSRAGWVKGKALGKQLEKENLYDIKENSVRD